MRTRSVLAFVLALAWCTFALAQPMQPVTTVAHFNVNFGKEEEFIKLVNEFDAPLFEKLMNEGVVLAWGVSTPVMHQAGAPTHGLWWTSPSMAQMDQVIAAFDEHEKKMMEENPQILESFLEIVDISKHSDHCFRDLVFGQGESPPPAGAKPYTWIYTTKVKPGHGQEYEAFWNKYTKPLLDKFVAEGLVGAYGLSIQEIVTTGDFTHFTWVSVPDFASYEKARGAYLADMANHPAEDMKKVYEIVDASASRSFVLREEIIHIASPPE